MSEERDRERWNEEQAMKAAHDDEMGERDTPPSGGEVEAVARIIHGATYYGNADPRPEEYDAARAVLAHLRGARATAEQGEVAKAREAFTVAARAWLDAARYHMSRPELHPSEPPIGLHLRLEAERRMDEAYDALLAAERAAATKEEPKP